MPTIEELQRFQFEDFALENTRRGKLTVLGEHAFGAEQGRIVTAPARVEAESGGGAVSPPEEEPTGACCIDGECSITTEAACVAAEGEYQGNNTTCDPNPCCERRNLSEISTISLTYRLQGSSPGTIGHSCNAIIDKTITDSWARVDRDFDSPVGPGAGEFQLWTEDCIYYFEGDFLIPQTLSLSQDITESGICNRPDSGGYHDELINDDSYMRATIGLGDNAIVELEFEISCHMISGGSVQIGSNCGYSADVSPVDLIPIDLSDLAGTYVFDETVTEATFGSSYTMTLTMVVS